MQARRLLEVDLRQAIEVDQFEVYYQPLVTTTTKQICGFEALVRWRHPTRGMVSPAEFIPVAEETGMIGRLGAIVLERACTEALNWPDTIKIAVNLSPLQFRNLQLAGDIAAILKRSGLPATRLELEVTESVLLQDSDTILAILHDIRSLGVRVSMDDFGTGYSSLSYLRRFPFDKIKIDQSFIRTLDDSNDCLAIVRAVLGLGPFLGHDRGGGRRRNRRAICATSSRGLRATARLPVQQAPTSIGRRASHREIHASRSGLMRSIAGFRTVAPRRSSDYASLSIQHPSFGARDPSIVVAKQNDLTVPSGEDRGHRPGSPRRPAASRDDEPLPASVSIDRAHFHPMPTTSSLPEDGATATLPG